MKPKILFYDIETLPLKAWIWQPGQQYVGHKQLLSSHNMWDLISIQYCWNDGKPAKVLRYDKHGGTKGMIETFDKLVKESDLTIGKNSDRFDTKMINSLRMMNGIKGYPEWTQVKDDLEKQMRRQFRLPSQSLDYISDVLGFGGKDKMEMSDWIEISNYRQLTEIQEDIGTKASNKVAKHLYGEKASYIRKVGKIALNKMCNYGAKDTEDTRALWYYLEEHFTPNFNMATFTGERISCKRCGSKNLRKNGKYISAGQTRYQQWRCNSCHQYAGRTSILVSGNYGKIS